MEEDATYRQDPPWNEDATFRDVLTASRQMLRELKADDTKGLRPSTSPTLAARSASVPTSPPSPQSLRQHKNPPFELLNAVSPRQKQRMDARSISVPAAAPVAAQDTSSQSTSTLSSYTRSLLEDIRRQQHQSNDDKGCRTPPAALAPEALLSTPRQHEAVVNLHVPTAALDKNLLRQTQEEVVELRKALLQASDAVYAARQDARVEQQRRAVTETERQHAIQSLERLQSMMEAKQQQVEIELSARTQRESTLKDKCHSAEQAVELANREVQRLTTLCNDEQKRSRKLAEDLHASQEGIQKLRERLAVAKTVVQKQKKEIEQARRFIRGPLSLFLRDAAPFVAEYRTAHGGTDLYPDDSRDVANTNINLSPVAALQAADDEVRINEILQKCRESASPAFAKYDASARRSSSQRHSSSDDGDDGS